MAKTRIIGVYDTKEEALEHERQFGATQKIAADKLVVVGPEDHMRVPLRFLTQRDLLSSSLVAGGVWGAGIGLVLGFLTFAMIGLPTPPFQSYAARLIMYLVTGTALGALFGLLTSTLSTYSSTEALNSALAARLFRNKYLVLFVRRGHLKISHV